MKLFFLLMLSYITLSSHSQNSIYDFTVDSISNGRTIDFSNYHNKKILIVNTATLDKNISQIAELDKLQKRYPDSLVVIVLPCNDFNTEPANNDQISSFLQRFNNLSLVVGAKIWAKDSHITPLYQWISTQTLNDSTVHPITAAFQKYLFNESGTLIAFFDSGVRPLNATIMNAIHQ